MRWRLHPSLLAIGALWAAGAAPAWAGPACKCGDGVTCGSELCDDGNTVNDPNAGGAETCSFPSCLPYPCGDGVPNPDIGQVCDDGNTVNDDDCANDCTSNCGNGVPNGTEQCDDGNTIDDDACTNQCQSTDCGIDHFEEVVCASAVNKNHAGVVKAVNGNDAGCVKAIAQGGATSCLGTDPKEKLAKARAKTTATFDGKKCDIVGPAAGLTDPTIVNAAGPDAIAAGFATLFGSDPAIFVTSAADKAGAACQAEALKQYQRIVAKSTSEGVKAVEAAMRGGKGGTPLPKCTSSGIAAVVDEAIQDSASLARATTKAGAQIGKKCTGDVGALFACGGTANTAQLVTACAITAAKEAACQALSSADGIDLTCPSDLP